MEKVSLSDIPESAGLILFWHTIGKSNQASCNMLILLHLMISVTGVTVYTSAASRGGFLTIFYCLKFTRLHLGKQILKLV